MTDQEVRDEREALIEKAVKAIVQYERELDRKRGDESERIWGHRGAFVGDFHPTIRGRVEAALTVFEQAHAPTSDDEREALDYVIALNEHAEEQFSRGVESAHGYDEESFIAGVRWALARKQLDPEWEGGKHPEPETVFVLDGLAELSRNADRTDLLPLPLAFVSRKAVEEYLEENRPLWGSYLVRPVRYHPSAAEELR